MLEQPLLTLRRRFERPAPDLVAAFARAGESRVEDRDTEVAREDALAPDAILECLAYRTLGDRPASEMTGPTVRFELVLVSVTKRSAETAVAAET